MKRFAFVVVVFVVHFFVVGQASFEGVFDFFGDTITVCEEDGFVMAREIFPMGLYQLRISPRNSSKAKGRWIWSGYKQGGLVRSSTNTSPSWGKAEMALSEDEQSLTLTTTTRRSLDAPITSVVTFNRTSDTVSSANRTLSCGLVNRTDTSTVEGTWSSSTAEAAVCVTQGVSGRDDGFMEMSFQSLDGGDSSTRGYVRGPCHLDSKICEADAFYADQEWGIELVAVLSNASLLTSYVQGPFWAAISSGPEPEDFLYQEDSSVSLSCDDHSDLLFNPFKCRQFNASQCLANPWYCTFEDSWNECRRNTTVGGGDSS